MNLCEQCAQTLRPSSTQCPNCGASVIALKAAAPSKRRTFAIWAAVAAVACTGAGKFLGALAQFDPVAYGPVILPVQLMIIFACVVCALMGGTKNAPVRPAAKPTSVQKPSFTPKQRADMDRFVRMNRIGMASFLAAVAAGVCALCSACNEGLYVILFLIALAPCALVTIVVLYGIKTFVCPSCGADFSVSKAGSRRVGGEGGRCMSCGFDAYA